MATDEGRRAPRVPPHSTSMAARFAAAQEAGVPIEAQFPGEEGLNILAETRALIELLGAGFEDAHANSAQQSELSVRPARTYVRALDGLSRLVKLAEFHVAASTGMVA